MQYYLSASILLPCVLVCQASFIPSLTIKRDDPEVKNCLGTNGSPFISSSRFPFPTVQGSQVQPFTRDSGLNAIAGECSIQASQSGGSFTINDFSFVTMTTAGNTQFQGSIGASKGGIPGVSCAIAAFANITESECEGFMRHALDDCSTGTQTAKLGGLVTLNTPTHGCLDIVLQVVPLPPPSTPSGGPIAVPSPNEAIV